MPDTRIAAAPMNGGVSTQPQDYRQANQTETADNTSLFFQRGLEKRPGTVHIPGEGVSGDVSEFLDYTGTETNQYAFVHFVDIDDDNKFFLVFDEQQGTAANQLQAFNAMTGEAVTVQDNSAGAALTYLAFGSVTSKYKIKAITYGKTTLVLNTRVTTAVTGSAPGYSIVAQATTMPIPPGSDVITGTTYLQNDDIFHLVDDTDLYVPGIYKVLNGGDNDGTSPVSLQTGTGYSSVDEGPWYERQPAEAAGNSLDPDTMPVSIVWDGTKFILDQINWNDRLGGDSVTNPSPEFVGEKLNDLTVFQDRLWLGGETVVVSSQAGDLYNFWLDNPGNVVDSDPISFPLGGPKANTVQSLVPVQDTLLVFGSSGIQYEVSTPDSFTPSSVNIQPTTTLASYDGTRPLVVGSRVIFTDSRETYSNVYDYFYDFGSDANHGINTSLHCEGYLPPRIRVMTAAENDNTTFFVGASNDNRIYVNYFYWDVEEKLQSAWCRWNWTSDKKIHGLGYSQGTLYIIFQKDDHWWLESVDTGRVPNDEDSNGFMPYSVRLDRKQLITGSYSSSTNKTTWELPFKDEQVDTVVLGTGFSNRAGLAPTVTADNTGDVTVLSANGDYSDDEAWVGASYEMSAQLSQPFQRDEQGHTVAGIFQIRRAEFRHTDTTTYTVEVTPNRRPTVTKRFVAGRVGSASIGSVPTSETGQFTPIIFASSENTQITIKNDTPFPCLITKVEWLGSFQGGRTRST